MLFSANIFILATSHSMSVLDDYSGLLILVTFYQLFGYMPISNNALLKPATKQKVQEHQNLQQTSSEKPITRSLSLPLPLPLPLF